MNIIILYPSIVIEKIKSRFWSCLLVQPASPSTAYLGLHLDHVDAYNDDRTYDECMLNPNEVQLWTPEQTSDNKVDVVVSYTIVLRFRIFSRGVGIVFLLLPFAKSKSSRFQNILSCSSIDLIINLRWARARARGWQYHLIIKSQWCCWRGRWIL